MILCCTLSPKSFPHFLQIPVELFRKSTPQGIVGECRSNVFLNLKALPKLTLKNDRIPGIVSFNMTNNTWSNDTMPENAVNTFLVGLQNFGPEGILVSSGSSGIVTQSQSLNNITIYEPVNKTWHVQNTTGNAPLLRDGPCAVSILGDNGTYEM